MINESKPTSSQAQSDLLIGSGYALLIGGAFQLIITPGSSTDFLNIARPAQGETWATIQTTWASEPHTWLGVSQLIDNTSKPVTSITNVLRP